MWAPVLGLTALAGALRFVSLGNVPPGLYHDEAFNGLDALGVLEGHFPIYFAANHGREPLFIYLIAATVGLLGRSPGAVRLAAAICGTLTVPATYAMTRAWFDHRTALLSSALISTTVWHVQLSRVGFRAVMLPLAIACFLWWGRRAMRSRRVHTWLVTGTLYGLLFYTYMAARFTPIALLIFAAYLLLVGHGDRLWPGALYFGVGALVTLIPLGTYAAQHWDAVMGRPAQVSVLNSVVSQGDLWGTLGRQLIRTLGMFFVRGDSIARHNVPGRPVFTPLIGAAMLLGTVQTVARAKHRDISSALILFWVGTMLVPTVAAADAPHFLRAVGVLPPLVVLPALGLETLWRASVRQHRGLWGSVLVCLVLTFSLGAAVRDYFLDYGADAEAAYAFEAAATELSAEINRFTGDGWNGRELAVSEHSVNPGRHVLLDARLWQAWQGLPFLVPEQEGLVRFRPDGALPLSPADEMLLLFWPYDDLQPYLSDLPQPAQLEVHTGPLTRGDLEEKAYPAYVSYLVKPLNGPQPAPLAQFGESIHLTDLAVDKQGDTWDVRLSWSASKKLDEDYTAVVFVCNGQCRGDQIVAQDDAQPGEGYYPTHWWRPGDVLVDVHTVELPLGELAEPKIGVGLYAWPDLKRLRVTSASGALSEDMLTLSIGD